MAAADDELVQLLTALGSADKATRTNAEEMLSRGRTQPGFPPRLAAFAVKGPSSPEAFPLRQMSITVLKRLILEQWDQIAEQDKIAVKQGLVLAIVEANKNLRGLLQVCAAHVRSTGEWPELHSQLAAGLAQGTAQEAECCVEGITTLLEECGPDVARMLGPLQESMLVLASREESPPGLRRQCVYAFVAGINALMCESDDNPQVVGIASAAVPKWLSVAAALCADSSSWADQDIVACAFTAVRAATTLSRFRPLEAVMASNVETVLRPACLLVQKLETAYLQAVIDTDDGGKSEEDAGLAPLVAQLMELIQAMLERPKLRALLKGHSKNLLVLLVPFMRITEAQINAWEGDPNEFLAQEEDEHAQGCQIRYSGEGMVGEMMAHLKREAQRALAEVGSDLLERGERGRSAGEKSAWKLTEVGLFVFAIAASETPAKALQRSELAPLVPVALNLARSLCVDAAAPQFLRSRAFGTLRRLGDAVCALSKGDVPHLLEAAAASLVPAQPIIVRVSALRAFCRFLTACSDANFKASLILDKGVLPSLGAILQDASEELLHLTLESLCLIIKQCPDAMVSVQASLGPLVLEIWRRSRGDHMVYLQVLDLVSCAAGSHPSMQKALEVHLLPAVRADLQPEAEQQATACAIELYDTLLKRAAVPLEPQFWCCLEPLLSAVLRSSESMLLQNSCDVLCALSRKSPSQIVEGGLLPSFLQCAERFLGPDLDDDACLFVGPFVMLVLSTFGNMLSAELRAGLLRALVIRLTRAERPYLQQELIVVIARLMHEDLVGVVSVLSCVEMPDNGIGRTGLQVLLRVWLDNWREIRSRRGRNVTVSALCKLHAKCGEDPKLAGLQVGGASQHPLPIRILEVLVGSLEFENERCKKLRERPPKENDDDDEEEEDDSDDGDDEVKNDKKISKYLSDLVDLEDDSDDDLSDGGLIGGSGPAHEELERQDPFMNIDLRKTTAEYLVASPTIAGNVPELVGRISTAIAYVRAHPDPVS